MSFAADTEKEIRKITTTIRNAFDYPALAEVVGRYELISAIHEDRIHTLMEKTKMDHINFRQSLDELTADIASVSSCTGDAPTKNAMLSEIFQNIINFQMSAYSGLSVLSNAIEFPEAKALFDLGIAEKEESTLDLADIREHYLDEPDDGLLRNYSSS